MNTKPIVAFLAATLIWIFSTACSSKSRSTADLTGRSNDLTSSAVGDVLSGSADYQAVLGKLAEALAANPSNTDAQLFLAAVTVLDRAQKSLVEPTGKLHQMMQRAGIVNGSASGSLWDLDLRLESHGQGLFKNTTPTMGEIVTYVHDDLRPVLATFALALGTVPATYEYVIPASKGGRLLALLSPNQPTDLRLDYGDVQLVVAAVHGVLAVFDLLGTLDWNNLDLNDLDLVENPALDPLEVIHTTYPYLGRILRFEYLAQARQRLTSAWRSFERASAHIRGEDAVRQREGLVTLGRDTFASEPERQQFLALEQRVRTLGARVVDGFTRDLPVLFDVDPLTGNALPPESQAQINFYRFFVGVDPRELYFKTFVDPLANQRRLGVARLSDLTDPMATFADVVASIGGVRPVAGDLQELLYGIRVDDPPVSTKTIDGNFADWQADAVQVAAAPAAYVHHPAPELGALFAAVDGDYLYLYLDRDLEPYLLDPDDGYAIEFEGPNGTARVFCHGDGAGHQVASSYGEFPAFAHNAQGVEMRFRIMTGGTGDWARLTVRFDADNASWQVGSERANIVLRVR